LGVAALDAQVEHHPAVAPDGQEPGRAHHVDVLQDRGRSVRRIGASRMRNSRVNVG
jgi:hypothetical protein